MTYKASALFILTIALSTNGHAKKDDYAACMKKAQKQFDSCTKENKKREKRGVAAINCGAIQILANKLCEEQHPINHTTFDSKRSSQATSSDTASTSSQQSSTPSPDSSPRSSEPVWSNADNDILDTYHMSSDGFLEGLTSRKECKEKIRELLEKIKHTQNSNDVPPELIRALNKLCTISFPQEPRHSRSISSHSFPTPSLLDNMNKASSSSSSTPEDGSLSQNPMRNPALD
ncbi:MAG: hypothetical protein KF820_03445 [Candidatus Paracaedibacteraceae bacterium]|nr:hypothetical protein [Candidatus Paracaedibacteraceae bacterium]